MKENEHDRALTCFNEAVRIYRQKDGGEDELAGTLFYLGRIFVSTEKSGWLLLAMFVTLSSFTLSFTLFLTSFAF